MNIYHRINSYLLERYPTVWNTRLIWMLLIGVGIHLVFFLFGYLHLDIYMLKGYGLRDHFFKIQYFSMYLICCLIALIFFSFKYYTHNPFRNYYPIPSFYFWRVYIQLTLIMFVFLTVQISFENGMRTKLRQMIPPATLSKQIKDVNLAYPFLYENKANYHIEKRSYPAPFPLEELSDVVIGKDTVYHNDIRNGINEAKPYVTLNDHRYQFGRTRIDQLDSCKSEQKIISYTDVSQIYGLQEYSLYNFSDLYITDDQEQAVNEIQKLNGNIPFNTFAPRVHEWQKTKNVKAIENALQQLINICRQYQIKCNIDAGNLATLGLQQDLNLHQQTGTQFLDEYSDEQPSPFDVTNESHPEGQLHLKEAYYSVDLQKFSNIVVNYNLLATHQGSAQLETELVWIYIIMAMVFAFILLMTKYVHFRDILIGSVLCGILIASFSFYYFLALDGNNFLSLCYAVAAFVLLIIVVSLALTLNQKTSKSLIFKIFLPLTAALLILLPLLYAGIVESTVYDQLNPCFGYSSKMYRIKPMPWHFLLMEIPALHIIFSLLKKIQGRPF